MDSQDAMPGRARQDIVDVDLTGVWHTVKAAISHLRAAGGGSVILTGSAVGRKTIPDPRHCNSAETECRAHPTLALELAPDMIRVNSVHPTTVKPT